MRFVIYKEEFLDGKDPNGGRSAMYATQEAIAMRELMRVFAEEVQRMRARFADLVENHAPDALVATADGGRRILRVGLLDEHAKRAGKHR